MDSECQTKNDKEAARTVSYEVEMFSYAVKYLEKHKGKDPSLDNLILEAALVHARALSDFFHLFLKTPKKSRKKDIYAEHYFENKKQCQDRIKELKFSYLEVNRERLNKAIAHITYSRVEYERQNNKEWELRHIAKELDRAWKSFLNALEPPERRNLFALEDSKKPSQIHVPKGDLIASTSMTQSRSVHCHASEFQLSGSKSSEQDATDQ